MKKHIPTIVQLENIFSDVESLAGAYLSPDLTEDFMVNFKPLILARIDIWRGNYTLNSELPETHRIEAASGLLKLCFEKLAEDLYKNRAKFCNFRSPLEDKSGNKSVEFQIVVLKV